MSLREILLEGNKNLSGLRTSISSCSADYSTLLVIMMQVVGWGSRSSIGCSLCSSPLSVLSTAAATPAVCLVVAVRRIRLSSCWRAFWLGWARRGMLRLLLLFHCYSTAGRYFHSLCTEIHLSCMLAFTVTASDWCCSRCLYLSVQCSGCFHSACCCCYSSYSHCYYMQRLGLY